MVAEEKVVFRAKIALEDSTCKGAYIYRLAGTLPEEDALKHCATASRYYVAINESFSYEQSWRQKRQVKNPEVTFSGLFISASKHLVLVGVVVLGAGGLRHVHLPSFRLGPAR